MANLFEVKHEDIEALKPDQCVDLLRRLLICEAQKHQLAIKELHVPLNIFVPDDGEDGRIEFYTDPPQESQLSNRLTVFQCKAEYLTPAKCAKEICIKGSTVLKPLVEECLDAGSDYMFFTSHGLTKKQIKKCIKAVRSSIQNAGKEYSKTANIQIIDANRVRDWSNQFVAAVTAVQSWRGTPQVPGLFTWQGWSQDPEFSGFEFVADDTRTKHIQELRSHLSSARQSARIVGLSGLGKTRLALETFRPEENGADHSKNLNWKVAYLNARDQPQGLPGTVSSWVGTGLEGILIVDDCPLELHESLQKKIEHKSSCLSLLTLDFNPDQVSRFDRIIHLEPVSDELIKGMLKSVYTDRPDYELGQIAALADGFPQMAVLLAKARLVQGLHLDQVVDPALLQKLIGNVETQAEEVLKICALFEQLGFSGGREGEYQYVANTICQDINPDVFYRRVKEFVNRGIINQAGGYVRVEPRPLAVRLAAKWWEGCSPQKAREIMEKMPNPMVEALCDRMAMLDRLPQARAMVGEWCGDQGPFGQAEALNSERGSRLFRSLSEVNPAAALSALERAFGNWSREALMEIGAGRRNLIWTLEKLCFDGELFPRAARLMLAFAAAENETWDNNATGQFKQLFQLQQESTEAPPKDRTEIIDEALNSDDDHRRTIAVSALAMALNTHGSFRALGAERIGGGPLCQCDRDTDLFIV